MFKGKKVAILGLGLEGRDLAMYLLGENALITIFDEKAEGQIDFGLVPKKNISIKCGKNYLKGKLTTFDYIFRSPGVYRYLPEIIDAGKRGVKILSATKLFFERCPGRIIGVTGTKGKGTTATLIYETLKSAGKDVYLAGNIGSPLLELLPKLKKESWVILELSSFQLIDLSVSPHIAVVLNITQDHLDWHKSVNEYVEAKKNIVKFQKEGDFAVINEDYALPKSFSKETKCKIVFYSKSGLPEKYKSILLLKGEHNWENVAAATTVAKILDIKESIILRVLSTFKGLEHRLELVGEASGIKYYNDSFATGPQPASAALNSFLEPLTLILGGYDKGLNYKGLAKLAAKKNNLKNIILIGDLSDKLGKMLIDAGYKGNIVNMGKQSMLEIVKKACFLTPKGGVILLSPAAASFDMFHDYKERGKKFKAAFLQLNKNGQ